MCMRKSIPYLIDEVSYIKNHNLKAQFFGRCYLVQESREIRTQSVEDRNLIQTGLTASCSKVIWFRITLNGQRVHT